MKRTVDLSGEQDMDRLAEKAVLLAERIREEDPTRMFSELAHLCEFHPFKAAQLLMVFSAWFDVDVPVTTLFHRVAEITSDRTTLGRSA